MWPIFLSSGGWEEHSKDMIYEHTSEGGVGVYWAGGTV